MQMLLGLLLEGCSKTAGLLAFKLFLYLRGFCSEYKDTDSDIIHGLKVKHILNYFDALRPKAFALKQNNTQEAFPNKHTQMSATG